MLAHGFSTVSDAVVADCLAWRRNLFRRSSANAFLSLANAPPRRISRSSDAYETPLDGHRLRNHISDQFDDLLAIRYWCRSAIRTAPFADLRHAGAYNHFAVRYFTENGCSASLDGRDRFCCNHKSCSPSVQHAARLVDATGE